MNDLTTIKSSTKSVADNIKSMDKLNNSKQRDYINLHTKNALRLYHGFNADKNFRWTGIKSAGYLAYQLIDLTSKDNPFAQALICEFEIKLNDCLSNITNLIQTMNLQLKQHSESGIHINIFANPNPVQIELENISGYGFKLVQLLTQYDMLDRIVVTFTKKGLIAKNQGNKIINEERKQIRQLLTYLYTQAIKIFKIKTITREVFLQDNKEMISKLVVIIQEGISPRLTIPILRNQITSEFLILKNTYSNQQLDIIVDVAKTNGLVV